LGEKLKGVPAPAAPAAAAQAGPRVQNIIGALRAEGASGIGRPSNVYKKYWRASQEHPQFKDALLAAGEEEGRAMFGRQAFNASYQEAALQGNFGWNANEMKRVKGAQGGGNAASRKAIK